jgi:phosphotransferase system enzyme I (PtsI)
VDFFSIGTNDLIQYTLAADRSNETVADLYCAADPAVLRLIAMVASAARDAGIDLSVCGSIAGEPLYTLPLLGLGVRQLSAPPHQLPEIKRIVRGIDLGHARSVAQAALRCCTADEVLALLRDALHQALPDAEPAPSGPLGRPT